MNHEHFLHQTLELAQKAVDAGNHPFAAILVKDGNIIGTAQNSVLSENDVTSHAELNLVSWASKNLESEILKKCILYSSTEPCAMCTGAIVWSGIPTVIYACSAKELAQIAGGGFINLIDVFKKYLPNGIIKDPLLEKEGLQLHKNFF